MAVLGLRFCARAFSSCGKWGPLFIAVRGPLTIAASLVAEHRLQTRRLSNCGSRAQLLPGMWDLPRPGLEPVSPALAGGLSTTAPPGKPPISVFINQWTDKRAIADHPLLYMLLCSLSFSLSRHMLLCYRHIYSFLASFFFCPLLIFPWFKTETRDQSLSVGRNVKNIFSTLSFHRRGN